MHLNLHKQCGAEAVNPPPSEAPLESFRLAVLLSAKALVVSERSAFVDEAAFAGLVDFAPLTHVPQAFTRIANMTRAQRRTLAEERSKRFAANFRPASLFQSSGLTEWLVGRGDMCNSS